MVDYSYPGGELEVMRHATRWKAYLGRQLRPFLGERVLEVGAGLGVNTPYFRAEGRRTWTCLEPDPTLAEAARRNTAMLRPPVEVRVGAIADLPAAERFDCILYVDVLEHIDGDAAELTAARDRLTPGGHLVVISPAHTRLYSEFDRAVGHVRRYTIGSLRRIAPPGLTVVRARYLDCAGLAVSLGNRWVTRQARPCPWQIRLWDVAFVSASRVLDPLLGYRLGKSVLVAWKRD